MHKTFTNPNNLFKGEANIEIGKINSRFEKSIKNGFQKILFCMWYQLIVKFNFYVSTNLIRNASNIGIGKT